jgi:hypothetical protein
VSRSLIGAGNEPGGSRVRQPMHPHASVRGLVVILTIAVAACVPGGSAGPTGAASSSGPAATAGTSSSVPPIASPAAIALPVCTDPYALPILPALQFLNVRGEPGALLRHVIATSTGSFGFVVPLADSGQVEPDDLGTLVGTMPMTITFVNADSSDVDLNYRRVVTEARATLKAGTKPAVPLESRITADFAVVQVPDLDSRVDITVTLGWTDGCFTYRGDVSATAQVALAATVAACPTAHDGAVALATVLAQTPIKIGTVSHLLTIDNWIAKYFDGNADTSVSMFQDTDFRVAPQSIAAGKEIVVSEVSPDVRILSIDAQFYRLDEVLPDPSSASPDAVFVSTGVTRADGSIGVPVPTGRSKYVMEINVGWDSSCLSGYGREWVTIQTT